MNLDSLVSSALKGSRFDLDQIKSSVAKSDLSTFVRQCWDLIEPTNPIKWNWHLTEFCNILTDVKNGKIKRLIVNVPPGTSKSLFFSVFFNAWVWSDDPAQRFLTFSYTDDNTIRDNIRLRDIVRSNWYMDNFWKPRQIDLASDQWAKVRFNTSAKGWRIASSVGGVGIGEHPNYIIIDDPIKAEDARSETKRRNCNEWMSNTISTRLALDATIILVMQRLHEEDLSGYLLSKGGWEHVCFPMRFETHKANDQDTRNIPDPRDKRTIKGELLWPEQWNEEKVTGEELLLGLASSGQLQQRPVPEGGALFQREWFEFVDSCPTDVELCRGWDIAESDDSGDWTVGVKMARCRRTKLFYVVDVVRVRKTLVDDLIISTSKMDGVKCRIREGSGSGKATIKARSLDLAGFDYAASPETSKEGDKIQRSNPFRAQCEMRNVKIVRGSWNDQYLSVICSFPQGKWDDDVDGSSNAFNCLVDQKKIYEVSW